MGIWKIYANYKVEKKISILFWKVQHKSGEINIKKNQSKRLTEQHKESHGVIGIFGEGLAGVANAGEEDKNKTE